MDRAEWVDVDWTQEVIKKLEQEIEAALEAFRLGRFNTGEPATTGYACGQAQSGIRAMQYTIDLIRGKDLDETEGTGIQGFN